SELRLIENTNNDFFAVRCWQDRDTQIDFFTENSDAETSILRNASLRDVEAGENFDTRRNRELQRFGRRLRHNQLAVDAVTEFERVLKWFDVNVRRLLLDRLRQDQIDDLDDRRVFAVGSETIEIDL